MNLGNSLAHKNQNLKGLNSKIQNQKNRNLENKNLLTKNTYSGLDTLRNNIPVAKKETKKSPPVLVASLNVRSSRTRESLEELEQAFQESNQDLID